MRCGSRDVRGCLSAARSTLFACGFLILVPQTLVAQDLPAASDPAALAPARSVSTWTASAQTEPTTSESAPPALPTREQLETALAQSESAAAKLRSEAEIATGLAPEQVEQALRAIEAARAAWSRGIEAIARRDEATRVPDFEREPPSLLRLNELRGESERLARRIERADAALANDREALEKAEAERARLRRLQREMASGATEDKQSGAARLADLQARSARAQAETKALELEADRATRDALRTRLAQIETRREEITAWLRANPGAAQASIETLRSERGRVERGREAAARDLASVDLRLSALKARYIEQSSEDPALIAEIDLLQFERDAIAQTMAAHESRLQRLDAQATTLTRWARFLSDEPARDELISWHETETALTQELARMMDQREGRLADLRERLTGLRLDDEDSPGASPGEHADERPTGRLQGLMGRPAQIRQQLEKLLERQIAFHSSEVAEMRGTMALHARFAGDLQAATGTIPLRERLSDLAARLSRIWSYEITVVQDEPITVANAVLASFLLILGFTLSRRLSGLIRRMIETRVHLEPGVAGAVQSISFYVLVVSIGLLALRSVNFPLTAFTVLGGALAIGVGFGSQNVMNNFISGLILMLERPVRAYDVVETEGTHGTIEQIGARSTRIRASDGRHVIVPNSFFLENNVVNWTLSDELIRATVTVGVLYGSPTRLVQRLIEQVLEENDRVLRSPKAIVNFSDFGNDALVFQSHFWLEARTPMAVEQVKSEVRFRIDELFREHDLVIAFPQRDVHLDTASPLEVHVRSSPEKDEPD